MIDVKQLLALVALKDKAAIPHLRQLASQLSHIADCLERDQPWNRSTGGVVERIQMAVLGPDGQTKQFIDTNPGAQS